MIFKFLNFLFFSLLLFFNLPVLARCAVCYTNGLSGASIAVIIIVFSFILLFIGNKFLKKFLEKKNT
tara:strand:- start:174 stop:374 length:201 start_codon:yes stop_codon:yes gene_type:complete